MVEVEEDREGQEALVNGGLECLGKVCIVESEIPTNADNAQRTSGSEDEVEENPPPIDVQKSFQEMQNFSQQTVLLKAADSLHKAKTALIDAFCEQNRKRKKQTMSYEFIKT